MGKEQGQAIGLQMANPFGSARLGPLGARLPIAIMEEEVAGSDKELMGAAGRWKVQAVAVA